MIWVDVAILGCGWAGILVGYFMLQRTSSLSVVCVDKLESLGGLLKSETVNGFTFDVGGSHVIFSRDVETLKKMLSFLGNNVIAHRRRAYVLVEEKLVPYPFENGIWALPPKKRANILISFLEALLERTKYPDWRPKTFKEWIYGFFGKEIAKIYLEPYNEKMWKRDLDEIDVGWVYMPGRLPIPDWRDVVRAGAGIITEGYKEQSTFYYPLKGGIQALYNAVLEKAVKKGLKIVKGVKVNRIKRIDERWVINNSIESKKIVSTIPVNELLYAIDAPEYIVKLVRMLDYNSVVVVGVALKKNSPNMHWVYVPDKNIVFHRYAWISNYSPYNAPENCSSIIAEITVKPGQKIDYDDILDQTMDGLKRLNIVSESEKEVLFVKAWFNKYGYPIYKLNHSKIRREIVDYFNSIGIILTGRWGLWHYWNMDRVFSEAFRLASSLG